MIDTNRLANIIFSIGEKIPESSYRVICESIQSDQFTLSEYVMEYKSGESIIGKVAYLLEDGTKVLVSPELIRNLNGLNINKNKLEMYMNKSYTNFRTILETISDGSI